MALAKVSSFKLRASTLLDKLSGFKPKDRVFFKLSFDQTCNDFMKSFHSCSVKCSASIAGTGSSHETDHHK